MTTVSAPVGSRNLKATVSASTRPTTIRQLDEMVSRLREAAPAFVRLSMEERIALAQSMQAGYLRISRRSVEVA